MVIPETFIVRHPVPYGPELRELFATVHGATRGKCGGKPRQLVREMKSTLDAGNTNCKQKSPLEADASRSIGDQAKGLFASFPDLVRRQTGSNRDQA
jgi:hypothetical protein